MSKPGIKQVADVVALQAGSKVVNPDMTEYDGDQLVWRLKADTAQEQGEAVLLEQPRLSMVLNTGEHLPIQAVQGEFHKDKQVVFLHGDVLVDYQNWNLSSDYMFYTQRNGELIAPKKFILKQNGIMVTGTDLHVFRDEGKVQVMQGVHMRIEEAR